MTAPHEVPPTGALAARAEALRAMLPVLETPRARLRPPRLEDFPAWAGILCSERAVHMDGPYARDDAFQDFDSAVGSWLLRGFGPWTVEDRATGATLGFVAVNMEPSDHEPELGWFVLPMAEGRGLTGEAAAAARDWAWANGVPSLVSYVGPDNARSAALARRLGAARDPGAEAAFGGTNDADVTVWRHPRPTP